MFFKVASRYRDEAETNVTNFEGITTAAETGNRPLLLRQSCTRLCHPLVRHMCPHGVRRQFKRGKNYRKDRPLRREKKKRKKGQVDAEIINERRFSRVGLRRRRVPTEKCCHFWCIYIYIYKDLNFRKWIN